MFFPSLVFSLVAALTLHRFVRRHPATDPRLTATVLVLLLVLPLLDLLPKVALELPRGPIATSPHPLATLLPLLWAGGFVVVALRGLSDFLALRRWSRQSSSCPELPVFRQTLSGLGISRPVELRLHPDLSSPVVAGLWRPRIYLPGSAPGWSPQTLRMALLHELIHLQRRDLWMAYLARLVCLLHWFNPAVWWLRRTFLAQCEYACDAHLVEKGTDPQAYAHALCDLARSASGPTGSLAMAGHAPLRERILFLTRMPRRRSVVLPALLFLTASSAVALSLIRLAPTVGPEAPALTAPDGLRESELRFTADPFPAN